MPEEKHAELDAGLALEVVTTEARLERVDDRGNVVGSVERRTRQRVGHSKQVERGVAGVVGRDENPAVRCHQLTVGVGEQPFAAVAMRVDHERKAALFVDRR